MSRRHQIVGPLLLIAAGCLLLANRAGWLPDGFWDQLLGLWPVLLILAGLDLVFRRSDSGVAAFAGAAVVVGGRFMHLPSVPVAIAGAALCFGIRFAAIRRGWQLPVPRDRP